MDRVETVREAQWFLDAVHAPQAQAISRGDGVVVAVIDSGVDAGHPDLAAAVLPGASFGGSTSDAGRTDPVGHGTRMAGLIAAGGGGENRALGVAPGARILPVAVSTANGAIPSLAEPIVWAVDHGAKVINLSIARPGGAPQPPGEAAAITDAVARGVVVVVAVGNSPDLTAPSALAGLPGVIAVGGTDRSDGVFAGSLSDRNLALTAPADQIVTTAERGRFPSGYSSANGTSEATAIVSGVAALVRARYPDLDAANVVNRLVASADDRGPPGRDDRYGFGLVDAQRALTMDVPAVSVNPLGDPDAPPSPPSAVDDPFAVGSAPTNGFPVALLLVCGVMVLLVVAALVGLVVWLSTRRRRPPQLPYQYPPTNPPRTTVRGPDR